MSCQRPRNDTTNQFFTRKIVDHYSRLMTDTGNTQKNISHGHLKLKNTVYAFMPHLGIAEVTEWTKVTQMEPKNCHNTI